MVLNLATFAIGIGSQNFTATRTLGFDSSFIDFEVIEEVVTYRVIVTFGWNYPWD
jgi:hypothetical protein